jgi:hypothetical protein
MHIQPIIGKGMQAMVKFVLLVAFLAASGELQPYRTLTPPLALRECEQLKDNRIVQLSYLEDAWYGERMPERPVLVCVEYVQRESAARRDAPE